jgi:hypothetical protein
LSLCNENMILISSFRTEAHPDLALIVLQENPRIYT